MSWSGFRRLIYVLIPVTAFFVWADVVNSGASLQCWNWMYYTGVTTFAVAIALAIALPRQLDDTIEALRNNNTLVLTASELGEIKTRMAHEARPWRFWCAVLIFLVVFGGWIWASYTEVVRANLDLTQFLAQNGTTALAIFLGLIGLIIFIMAVCGFYAGAFFGTAAAHGRFASVLAGENIRLRIRPDHFDGASGLKPIGDFYLYQAFLTAMPLLWFAVWWLIIPIYKPLGCVGPEYSGWREPFVIMWLVTLAFTYLGFIRPILKLRRRVLGEQKRLESDDVPRIEEVIRGLQQKILEGGLSEDERKAVDEKIDRHASYAWSVRQMSAWPMDARTQRRYFSVQAIVSVVPPAIEGLTKIGAIAVSLPDDGSWKWLKAFVILVL
jgi:hypothetical protein